MFSKKKLKKFIFKKSFKVNASKLTISLLSKYNNPAAWDLKEKMNISIIFVKKNKKKRNFKVLPLKFFEIAFGSILDL
jgi:hypothetical protein